MPGVRNYIDASLQNGILTDIGNDVDPEAPDPNAPGVTTATYLIDVRETVHQRDDGRQLEP
ncbi:uncharacterized protein STEHIDRAFT_118658 [Stereum hirsutum FP-91666 SS1]|uniref:uncharacterized protein n=1 Tax=Stereum hirsutum (strain FP-91666) TaxID=721885 RepID=UPI000440EDA6|nr:uncharacterized protein STEHIDRAFT_118658 [Stereum hirsutum FP-91666 SS1]EIM91670.1 hypothetical protein STEHIDRAFT_118658 [Stereum hirsutum FP-91666 SS1]